MGSQRPSAQGVILGSIVRFVCQGYDAEGCGGRARLCGAGHAAAWEGLRERKRGRRLPGRGAPMGASPIVAGQPPPPRPGAPGGVAPVTRGRGEGVRPNGGFRPRLQSVPLGARVAHRSPQPPPPRDWWFIGKSSTKLTYKNIL